MRDTVSEPAADATAPAAKPTGTSEGRLSDDVRKANLLTWVVLAIVGGKFAILLIYALAARFTG